MIMFDPISEICSFMLFLEPWPMASIVMTEATPIMIPNIVRKQRSLLLFSAFSAIFRRFSMFIASVVVGWKCLESLAGRGRSGVEGVGHYFPVAEHDVARRVFGQFRVVGHEDNRAPLGV